MIEREVKYERNITGSYMKVSAAKSDQLDEKLLLRRKLKGLLGVELCYYNGQPWYWYNISGKQSLDTYCRLQGIGIGFIEQLILSICDEIEILEWNLLDQNSLVLDPEYIFVSNVNQEIIFTVYPGYHEEISRQLQTLMEYILTKVDHSDAEAVQAAYGVYEKTMDEAYSILDIREILLERRKKYVKDEEDIRDRGLSYPTKKEGIFSLSKHQEDKEHAENMSDSPLPETQTGSLTQSKKSISDIFCRLKNLKTATMVSTIEQFQGEWRKLLARLRRKTPKSKSIRDNFAQKSKGLRSDKLRKETSSKTVPAVVYPDEREEERKIQIHPTVCLSSLRNQPKGMLLYEGPEQIENITLHQTDEKIGKSVQADIRIERDTISQFHARIIFTDGNYSLEDLNSTNGTYVNEEPLAYKERRQLNYDDIVRFADVRFRFL